MTASEYLALGGAPVGAALDVTGALAYLSERGFAGGYLQQAREAVQAHQRRKFEFEALNVNYCDFCFAKLMGGEYDRLKDGRERCIHCSRRVLRTSEEFQETFQTVKRNLGTVFDVSLNTGMKVRMVNAKEIARSTGETFQATPGVDARVLGFAEKTGDGYSLYIENGSPKLAAITTIAHELTHIWQYLNWDVKQIEERYGAHHRLSIYEGMATWAQVQYLLFLREFDDADRQEAYALQRTDEYGVGFRMFVERYPLARDGQVESDTPFRHPFPL